MCHPRTVLVKLFFLVAVSGVFNPTSAAATGDSPNFVDLSFLIKCQGLLAHAAMGGTIAYRMGSFADVFFPNRTSRQFIVTSSLQRTYPSISKLMPFLAGFTLERDAVDENRKYQFSGRWEPSSTDTFLFSIPPTDPGMPGPAGPARLAFYYYFSNFGLNTIATEEYIALIQQWLNAESKVQKIGSQGDVEFVEYRFSGIRGTDSDVHMKKLRSIYGNHSISVEIEDTDIRRVILTFQSLVRFLVEHSELQVSESFRSSLTPL